jgi:hypothetical protein
MTDSQIVKSLLRICSRVRLPYTTLAHLAGVGVSTAQLVFATSRVPRQARTRQALRRFVELNADAERREDLKLV